MARAAESGGASALRILISGGTGFIGSELVSQLEAQGHTILKLVRRRARTATEFSWDPSNGAIDPAVFDGVDAVINLSGVPMTRLPWTRGYQRQILATRVNTSRTLAEAMHAARTPPAVFLDASGVGIYGDRPGEVLTEESAKGEGFLSDVVEAWEAAAHLAPAGTRVVTLRTGLVVGRGGAFTPLVLLTRFGVAARLGRGSQYWPWISLHDEAAAIRHLLTSSLSGAVNLAGPTPATSVQVTRELARAMHRWHLFAIPEFLVRALLGTAGKELLLLSQQVVPARLLADGFEFRDATVKAAIEREVVTK